jgi:hypothetical protein
MNKVRAHVSAPYARSAPHNTAQHVFHFFFSLTLSHCHQTPLQVAQDAGIVARECVAALQRKWEELEAAAANAEKGLVKGERCASTLS